MLCPHTRVVLTALAGLVSSLAFCPDYSGLYAASSFSTAITLFSEATGDEPVAYLDGLSSSITQVRRALTHPVRTSPRRCS